MERNTLADGAVRLEAERGAFVIRRLAPGALLVIASGQDNGQFGTAVLDEFGAEIGRAGKLALFVDARYASGANKEVSDAWTAWFTANRERLTRVDVLATSKYMQWLVSLSRHFSRTEGLLRVHEDPHAFETAIASYASRGPS